MKRRNKLRIDILYLCFAILAVAVILLAIEVKKLGAVKSVEQPTVAKSHTLSVVMDLADPSELKTHEPPGRIYFDVPLEDELQDYIFDICDEYGVGPELIVSMIFHESNFDSAVIGENDSGYSYGLMQIMPR